MAPKAFSFGQDLWDPSHRFQTSWVLSPWILFFCRALFAVYILVTLLFKIGWYCTHDDCTDATNEFSYFTILTYWGLGFYFVAASVHTFTYALQGTPLLDRFPRSLQALHSAYYTTIVVYPFVVTIVYWGRLYSGKWFDLEFEAWSNVSQHGLNSFFALFEIIIPRTNPPPAVHMLWVILVLATYLALAYLTHATKGFYVYSFLDPSTGGWVAVYVFGIAVGSLLLFGFSWGLIWLRKFVTEKKMHMDGHFAGAPPDRWAEDRVGDPDLEMSTTAGK